MHRVGHCIWLGEFNPVVRRVGPGPVSIQLRLCVLRNERVSPVTPLKGFEPYQRSSNPCRDSATLLRRNTSNLKPPLSQRWKLVEVSIMAEVLGRYSNLGATGVKVRSMRNQAAKSVRSETWTAPKLQGGNRTRQILSGHEVSVRMDYEAGMGSVLLSRKYGAPVNTLLDWLRREGVEIRSAGKLSPEYLWDQNQPEQSRRWWRYRSASNRPRPSCDGCSQ